VKERKIGMVTNGRKDKVMMSGGSTKHLIRGENDPNRMHYIELVDKVHKINPN
jgi:hypothetical protein